MNAPNKSSTARPLHLAWDGTEWVDDRCGCRYHPDDPNMTHGGAPHIHRCEEHARKTVPPAENLKRGAPGETGWEAMTKAIGKVLHGPDYDPIVALEIKIKARGDMWIRETSPGSWLVWPFWTVGWVVGFCVHVIRGLWWNVDRGYKRVRTTPLDKELDK